MCIKAHILGCRPSAYRITGTCTQVTKLLVDAVYAPNFEKVGSILLSACASIRPFVRLFKKNLKLGI